MPVFWAEVLNLLLYDTVSLGNWFWVFWNCHYKHDGLNAHWMRPMRREVHVVVFSDRKIYSARSTVHLKSLLETAADVGAKDFVQLVYTTGLEVKTIASNMTIFVPSDDAVRDFTDNLQEAVSILQIKLFKFALWMFLRLWSSGCKSQKDYNFKYIVIYSELLHASMCWAIIFSPVSYSSCFM